MIKAPVALRADWRSGRSVRQMARGLGHVDVPSPEAIPAVILAFQLIVCAHAVDAAALSLRNGFHQRMPAKPRQPPTSSSHSGLSFVVDATNAAPSVTSSAGKVLSEACVRISALAAISPIDNGTSAA